jgi:hypothetical protein
VIRILWDASALAKRYIPEPGSQTVNAVFVAIPPAQMVTTIMSYAETMAALVRKLNQGVLDVATFTAAQDGLRNEVIDDPDFLVLGLEFDDILDGIELVKRHNLNSTDGAILRAFPRHAGSPHPLGVSVLAASDQRLPRASKAEGLEVLNPETVNAADIMAFLAAL